MRYPKFSSMFKTGILFPALFMLASSAVQAEETGTTGIQVEIGDDRILSSMGPYTNPDYDALHPAVAYNSTDNQ